MRMRAIKQRLMLVAMFILSWQCQHLHALHNFFNCKKVAWFMGFGWDKLNLPRLSELKFAILSAKQHAPMLQPIIIFQYPEQMTRETNAWLDWFKGQGVIICNQSETQILQELKKYGTNMIKFDGQAATPKKYPIYFRHDIDEYFELCAPKEDIDQTYALYTDSDVAIVQEINSCTLPKPQVMYMGVEHQLDKIRNSGVMIFNIKQYANLKQGFIEFIRPKWNTQNVGQKLIQVYFNFVLDVMQLLPNEYNYKMYWEGLNLKQLPVIFHSHGPKFQGPCTRCLLATSFKPEAIKKCPKCHLYANLWYMYGNPNNLFQMLVDYYSELVYKSLPYFNETDKTMHI